MNLLWGVLIVVAVTGVAVTAMSVVRRNRSAHGHPAGRDGAVLPCVVQPLLMGAAVSVIVTLLLLYALWSANARTDVQRAINYVLGVVLFAAALFFAGMSTKLP